MSSLPLIDFACSHKEALLKNADCNRSNIFYVLPTAGVVRRSEHARSRAEIAASPRSPQSSGGELDNRCGQFRTTIAGTSVSICSIVSKPDSICRRTYCCWHLSAAIEFAPGLPREPHRKTKPPCRLALHLRQQVCEGCEGIEAFLHNRFLWSQDSRALSGLKGKMASMASHPGAGGADR